MFVWYFSCFFRQGCIAINFPLINSFASSHKFWVIMFSLSLVSGIFKLFSLTFLVISCLICSLLVGYWESNGNPLQYSCLENPMDGEAWWTTVHGAAKSRTELNDLTFTFTERGTGRKARGPQLEEMDCNCQTSFSFLVSGRRKQTTSVRLLFPPSLYKIKRFLLKFWFHPNLTFLKPWANQCIFLMEMFFLSYFN